ncbi:DUF1049 domain-containing protein [Mesobaculum littorinae]|uniref:DUF1049 domain-containing protein n=1 Tax=Mesobaculum littorinae TaxID=2486419 RepID=A0A438AF41_9RHOB|nr:DUF1049 domain-containing protein [Mesobaculum littorinae]
MRYLRYAILAIVAICLVTIALANRELVTLRLLPDSMAGFLGLSWSITLPLFLILLIFIVLGLALGYLLEWRREHKHRAAARRERRRKEELEREVVRLKTPASGGSDDVIALLEDGSTPR